MCFLQKKNIRNTKKFKHLNITPHKPNIYLNFQVIRNKRKQLGNYLLNVYIKGPTVVSLSALCNKPVKQPTVWKSNK